MTLVLSMNPFLDPEGDPPLATYRPAWDSERCASTRRSSAPPPPSSSPPPRAPVEPLTRAPVEPLTRGADVSADGLLRCYYRFISHNSRASSR